MSPLLRIRDSSSGPFLRTTFTARSFALVTYLRQRLGGVGNLTRGQQVRRPASAPDGEASESGAERRVGVGRVAAGMVGDLDRRWRSSRWPQAGHRARRFGGCHAVSAGSIETAPDLLERGERAGSGVVPRCPVGGLRNRHDRVPKSGGFDSRPPPQTARALPQCRVRVIRQKGG